MLIKNVAYTENLILKDCFSCVQLNLEPKRDN